MGPCKTLGQTGWLSGYGVRLVNPGSWVRILLLRGGPLMIGGARAKAEKKLNCYSRGKTETEKNHQLPIQEKKVHRLVVEEKKSSLPSWPGKKNST